MSNGIRYRVQTHWGYFSLDEDSYQDYLAGKLWIIWKPGKTETPKPEAELTHLSAEAIRLRESAHADAYSLLQVRFPATAITPYQKRMENVGIDELLLSVRSSNGLHGDGLDTLGGVMKIMEQEGGLRSVRNLGTKSEAEIRRHFINYCYSAVRYLSSSICRCARSQRILTISEVSTCLHPRLRSLFSFSSFLGSSIMLRFVFSLSCDLSNMR